MAPIWYIFFVLLAFFIVWSIAYKKKHGTYGVSKNKSRNQEIFEKDQEEQKFRYRNKFPAFKAIDIINKEKQLNHEYQFELKGVHVPAIKKFLKYDAYLFMHVQLKAEPENLVDPNAIAVYTNNFKIGYVDKKITNTVMKILQNSDTNSYISLIDNDKGFVTVFISINY